ncbi:class I tRNA ligase family protein [Paenibacillus sp. SC116]|uniref:class I tRNA ligase family protein n=1 Tax=Paenibacillus sp. SC116 TaxID=2968986 RepID=UPI00215B188A|nr:class I tRNA ligase family protein [Paenibacillus sp. SC116]MCR8842147.1 class I tRNA ligase family protein [Paenibacillus sp. SC116]
MCKKFIVTATPPTTNGDLHLGHVSGPYLGADIFTRAQRLMNHEVLYISSTDDNQSYLLTKAIQEKRSPKDVVEDYSAKIKKSLQLAQVRLDEFTSPDHPIHVQEVQKYFMDLYNQGYLVEKEMDFLYCEHCQQHLYEAFVKGICPTCTAPCGGNFCEECGNPNDPLHMLEPVCLRCESAPSIRSNRVIVFPLEKLRSQLEVYYNQNSYKWKSRLREWYRQFLSRPLPEVPVSNVCEWGVPVPLEALSNQVINVWFEMLPGHLATIKRRYEHHSSENGLQWDGNEDVSIVQFFGFDNSFYYTVLHTAMIMGLAEQQPADSFIINEFYLLENKKFSTSRKHAVWASEFITPENSDLVRLYLSMTGPEHRQTNFAIDQFHRTSQSVFNELFLPFLSQNSEKGQVGAISNENVIQTFKGLFEQLYSDPFFSPSGAVHALKSYAAQVRTYDDVSKGQALLGLCLFAYPIMPTISAQLWMALTGKLEHEMSWNDLNLDDLNLQKALDVVESRLLVQSSVG